MCRLFNVIIESNRYSVTVSRILSVREKFLESFSLGSTRQTTANSSVSELFRNSKRKGPSRSLTMIEKFNLMLGACRGVAFLHSKGYMHCDIKSPNFLIGKV
jgi:serine/threonine protein kinase